MLLAFGPSGFNIRFSLQGRRKQIKSVQAISSVRAKHALTRGVWGHDPPGKFCFFEVVSEPIPAKCKR